MEKKNGKYDSMETKLHQNSLRQKSKVPRTRLPQRFEYVDTVTEYRNGSARKDYVPKDHESQGMNAAPLHLLADTDENKEWQRLIGHRVCISGVKPGILRYFGRTNFAQGYWCGVELDEPVGKHNGTVNGIVYFKCKPNHGIFAPVSKVSKLNDLNACSWQLPSRPQESHSNCDYNLGFVSESPNVKYVKNSISDPTSLRPRMRLNMPHCSQSFTCDARNVTEKRRSESLSIKALRNFETPDLSSRHTNSFSGSSSINVINNSFSSHSLSKYGCEKNKFLCSNVMCLGDNPETLEQMREMYVNRDTRESNVNKQSNNLEEYERYIPSQTRTRESSALASEFKHLKEREQSYIDSLRNKMPEPFLNSFTPFDYSELEDEMDNDDQMSVDYDESLGILTPSQMKDFNLCPDFPTSSSEIKGVAFPSSESFDDINELPEDEQVHDVSVQYVAESAANRNIEITREKNLGIYNKDFILSNGTNKIEKILSSTDKFLSSISQKDCERFSADSGPISSKDFGRTYVLSNVAAVNIPPCNFEKELNDGHSSSISLPKARTLDFNKSNTLGSLQETFTPASNLLNQYSEISEQNEDEQNQPAMSCNNLTRDSKFSLNVQSDNEELSVKQYEADISHDSVMQVETENILKEKLTVSWEDCAPHSSSTFPSIERPESVYTVGSSDTGFQEDGELELETGMATSIDSTDSTKRFSSASRDSCIVSDEVDVYKIAESNSTSGYSTGLSDSCCNDRPEDDLSSKPLTEEFQDSVGLCDSEDGFSFQENNSLSKDSEMLNAEMSDVTAETVTAMCNDSTSDGLCETMVEDTTLTEIHDILSPEEAKSSNLSDKTESCDAPIESKNETTNEANTRQAEESTPSVSTNSPAQSTPEKKTTGRPKFDAQKRQPLVPNKTSRTSRVCDDESNKNKLVPKSPKKNVMSKIKAMIEATSCKNGTKTKTEVTENVPKRVVSAPKKSRWDAVTSKIAAGLAEEKTKPKTKREIKSRVDTNLSGARQQVITCKSPKLDSSCNSNCGDGTLTPVSVSSKDRRPLTDRNSAINLGKEVRAVMAKEAKQVKNQRPGKSNLTSRPTSPVAASECSTTSVSVHSLNSRSKITHWKGSTSTIASSVPPALPPIAVKRQTPSTLTNRNAPLSKTVNRTKKPISVPKIRVTSATPSVRLRSVSPASSKPERNVKHSRTSKEQTGVRGASNPSKPVRPPMWLSKAELTQEIQRLGTLCEARTKELNKLKMETKHVSAGFDAFAALFKYMVDDLNGLSVPMLSKDLEKTLKQLELAKQDLAYYEREVEEMKAHHSQELNDLSNKLFEVYQGELTELSTKHQEELEQINYNHQQQIENLSESLKTSSQEIQSKHDLLISELQQELIAQREELQQYQEREIKDMEEKHNLATKTLQEHIVQLQKKCAELNQHSMSMEDAMRKDTDSKLQWVTTRKIDLEKEVESLKSVLEMKNQELHSLRVQTLEMEKQLEELPLAREKIKMLQARAEDLEALMIEKTKLERKLSTENQLIKDTYEKESKVNKRLSMENEELQWRLRQAENSLLSGSFSEVSEYPEEENGTTSPVKTSPAPQMSRSVFFTFIDKDESPSQSSPKSHYKKILPSFSANYKTSPGKSFKSPIVPSPRRSKSHSEPPQPVLSCTPRKTLKQKGTAKRPRSGSDSTRLTNDGSEVVFHSVTGSMASSMSSESSVFEQKEQLLEEHEDQIMETLEILREQRNLDSPSSEPITPNAIEKEWPSGDSKEDAISPDFEAEDMSRSSEFSDPKTYYHMTFPVPKETGIPDDNGKNSSDGATPSEEPKELVHSILEDIPIQEANILEIESNVSQNLAQIGNENFESNVPGKQDISVENQQSTESEAQDQWRTI